MIRFKDIIKALIGYPTYLLSKVIPKDNNKWCFGGEANSLYYFRLVDFKSIGVRAIWYSNSAEQIAKLRESGYEAYSKTSLKGFYHLMTAKIYVITHEVGDINRWTSGGSKILNVFHGLPYKKIGLDDKRHHYSKAERIVHYGRGFDLQLVTSPLIKEIYLRSFKIKDNRCVESQLPRNMILLKPKEEVIRLLNKWHEYNDLKIIEKLKPYHNVYIYMPTFRDSKRDFLEEANFDFEKLNDLMKRINGMFIFKLHPVTKSKHLDKIDNYSNLMVVNKDYNVYSILPFTTCLITDYSSIYFDYALTGKRIIFYTFDFDEYTSQDRDMNFDNSYMQGEYCNTFNELIDKISDVNAKPTDQSQTLKVFWNNHKDIDDLVKGTIELSKL